MNMTANVYPIFEAFQNLLNTIETAYQLWNQGVNIQILYMRIFGDHINSYGTMEPQISTMKTRINRSAQVINVNGYTYGVYCLV